MPDTTRAKEIPVDSLRVGMTLTDDRGNGGEAIKSIVGCTQRGFIHVNGSKCFDRVGFAWVKR